MALDQVHIPRLPAALGVGGAHGAELPLGKRRQQASPHVVGKADAPDDPVDPVAVGDGVLGPLEQEYPGTFADHQPVSGSVERGADPAAREGAQLGKAHLGIERIGAGESAGQHGVGAAGKEFVDGEFYGIEGGGAGGVQGAAPPAQAERLGEESGGKAGDVAVQRVGCCPVEGAAEEFFLEGAAQPLAGEEGGFFARQGQVADDDADPGTVERRGDAVVEGAFAGMEQEMEEGIEPGQKLRIDGKPGQQGERGDRLDETAAPRIDPVRGPRLRGRRRRRRGAATCRPEPPGRRSGQWRILSQKLPRSGASGKMPPIPTIATDGVCCMLKRPPTGQIPAAPADCAGRPA